LSSRKFWFVLALTGLTCGVVQSLVAHFVAFSAELGVGVAAAAMALSAFSLAGPIGPLLAGAVADRTRSPKPLLMFYALPAAGLLLFQSCGAPAAIPSMVLMGMGFQAATGMLPYLLTRYFGVRHASQLFGWGLGVVTLAMGAGPVILGYVRDRVQAFGPAAPGLLLFLAVALALLLTLPSYQLTALAEPRPKNEGPLASP
jgi:MFS family permease